MKKILTIYLILTSLLLSACPKPKVKAADLETAFNYTKQIAKESDRAVIAVGDLFEAKVISYELKEKIVSKIKILKDGNAKAINLLSAIKTKYAGQSVPDGEIAALDLFFDQNILSELSKIIVEAAGLSPATAQQILLAIAFLKQIIFTVSGFFGQWSSKSASAATAARLKESYAV